MSTASKKIVPADPKEVLEPVPAPQPQDAAPTKVNTDKEFTADGYEIAQVAPLPKPVDSALGMSKGVRDIMAESVASRKPPRAVYRTASGAIKRCN